MDQADPAPLAPSVHEDVTTRVQPEIACALLIMEHMLHANEEQFRQAQLDDSEHGPILRYLKESHSGCATAD